MAKRQIEVGYVCFSLIIFGELHRLWSLHSVFFSLPPLSHVWNFPTQNIPLSYEGSPL